jgi:uncharacterized protein (DUF433 family)
VHKRRSQTISFEQAGSGGLWNTRFADEAEQTCDPDRSGNHGDTAVFVGTRVPFETLLDYLKAGQPLSDFLEDFPTVTRTRLSRLWSKLKRRSLHVCVLPDDGTASRTLDL